MLCRYGVTTALPAVPTPTLATMDPVTRIPIPPAIRGPTSQRCWNPLARLRRAFGDHTNAAAMAPSILTSTDSGGVTVRLWDAIRVKPVASARTSPAHAPNGIHCLVNREPIGRFAECPDPLRLGPRIRMAPSPAAMPT